MLITWTVPDALPLPEVFDALSAAGLPQAASRPPAPPTAASVPADFVMKARRVDRDGTPPVCMTIFSPPGVTSGAGPGAVDRRVVPRDEEPLQRDDREIEQEAEERQHEDDREQRLGFQVVQAGDDAVAEALVPTQVL